VQTVREPLLVLDADLRVKTASRSFYKFFKVTPKTPWAIDLRARQRTVEYPALKKLLYTILPEQGVFDDFAVDGNSRLSASGECSLNARRLNDDEDITQLILLAFEESQNGESSKPKSPAAGVVAHRAVQHR